MAWHISGTAFLFLDSDPKLRVKIGRFRMAAGRSTKDSCDADLAPNRKRREADLKTLAMTGPHYTRAIEAFNQRFGSAKFTGLSVEMQDVGCEQVG